MRYYNRCGVSFIVLPPKSQRVQKYLNKHRFWERFNIGTGPSSVFSIGQGNGFTSFNDIIDIERSDDVAEEVGEMVYDLLSQTPIGVNASLMEIVTTELVDNFSQHSEEQLAICAVQWYPNVGRFDLAIGDCGIGIRESLATNQAFGYLQDKDHMDAAIEAFREKVTRKNEGGMGLPDVRDSLPDLKGHLFLSTGNAWVFTDRNRSFRTGQQQFDLPGVQIELSIQTAV